MTDGRPSLGRPGRLALDDAGDIYVADTLESRVRVFGADGTLRRSFGRHGDGPEEFSQFIRGVAVAGDWVAVSDLGHRELSVWTREGDYVKAIPMLGETPDGGAIGGFWDIGAVGHRAVAGLYFDEDPTKAEFRRSRIALLDLESGESRMIADVPRRRAYVGGENGRRLPVPMLGPDLQFATGPSGLVYATAAESYEVAAFAFDDPRWMLQVPWERLSTPDQDFDRALATLRSMPGGGGRAASVRRSQIVTLPYLPALKTLRVDDVGRLYVFPLVYYTLGRLDTLPDLVPVDVYSPTGERLVAGLLPARFAVHPDESGSWLAAHDGYIYGIETDEATQDLQIVRYRVPTIPQGGSWRR